MFPRIALAALLIACLAQSANAQKDKPKPTTLVTWETLAADKAAKMVTKRAQVPGGWLVLVQSGDDMCLTFLPDAGHAWDDGSPSDKKPGKPTGGETTNPALDKLKAELENARAAAQAERDKAEAAQKKAEIEAANLRTTRKALERAQTVQKEADRQRAIAREALQQEATARREALAQRVRAEAVAARAADEAAQAKAEARKLQAELDQARKEAERLRALLEKKD